MGGKNFPHASLRLTSYKNSERYKKPMLGIEI